MEHLFIKAKNDKRNTLILFHGSGGRETDLLEIAAMMDGSANILAFRGSVEEEGRARFFRRKGAGYDEDSLKSEGLAVRRLMEKLAEEYDLDLNQAIYVGYSHGADMASHLLMHHDLPVAGAMLMHPSYNGEQAAEVDLSGKKILLTAGARDVQTTAGEAYQLRRHLEQKGAEVSIKLTDGGHEIDPEELMEGHVWYLGVK